MRILGFEISRTKAASAAASTATAVSNQYGLWPWVRESFTGAWQRNITVPDNRDTLLAHSAIFSCVTLIASDIAKLPIRQMVSDDGVIWKPARDSAVTLLLNRPNHYQTRAQFFDNVVLSRLIYGNAYILKQRDARGKVVGLYVLAAPAVTVLVAEDGSIFYRLKRDNLNGRGDLLDVTVPASEIIHDRGSTLFHPLIGVSPIFACAWAATLSNRIQQASAQFFANGGRPSGVLTAPGAVTSEAAARMKEYWDENFSGTNAGRVAILGDGLKYEAMTMNHTDAQLIEQLKWSVEDVARCFRVPLYMLAAGQQPTFNNVESLQRAYLQQTLQAIIESLEILFDREFDLRFGYERIEFDTDELLRMDSATRYEGLGKAIGGGWMAPNEARAREGLPPVAGGDTPYMQMQNYSLAALAKRDAPPSDARSTADEAVTNAFADAVRDELGTLLKRD